MVKCSKCMTNGPDNIVSLGGTWECPGCVKVNLVDDIKRVYANATAGRFVYISEFENNLSKVHTRLVEEMALDKLLVSISLVHHSGITNLKGIYDGVYYDSGSVSPNDLQTLEVAPHAFVRAVNPTSLELE